MYSSSLTVVSPPENLFDFFIPERFFLAKRRRIFSRCDFSTGQTEISSPLGYTLGRSGLMTDRKNLNRETRPLLLLPMIPENNERREKARTFPPVSTFTIAFSHRADRRHMARPRLLSSRSSSEKTPLEGGVGRRSGAVARSTIITITGNYLPFVR